MGPSMPAQPSSTPAPAAAPVAAAPAPVPQPAVQPTDVHPAFGPGPVAIISGENALYPQPAGEVGHANMGRAIAQMGLKGEPTRGKYGAHEPSWLVYGAGIPQLQELGKRFGQESVAVRMNGKNFFLFTNGPKEGHASVPVEGYEQYAQEPQDYYTVLPGPNGQPHGYFKWNIDFDSPHVPLHMLDQHLNGVPPIQAAQRVLKAAVESYHNILLGLRSRELAKGGSYGQYASPGYQIPGAPEGWMMRRHSRKGYPIYTSPEGHAITEEGIYEGAPTGRFIRLGQMSQETVFPDLKSAILGQGGAPYKRGAVVPAGQQVVQGEARRVGAQPLLGKAEAGERIAPHQEPGVHESTGKPHMEPGIHERPAQTAKKPETSTMKKSVFDLVSKKANGGPVRTAKAEPAPTAYFNPNVGQGGGTVQCECGKVITIPGVPQQPATGVAGVLATSGSGQMPTALPKAGENIAGKGGSHEGSASASPEASASPVTKAETPGQGEHPGQGRPAIPVDKRPTGPMTRKDEVCKCGKSDCQKCQMQKQETDAVKHARANGGSVRVMGMVKKEVIPTAKGIKEPVKAPGSGGQVKGGLNKGAMSMGPAPAPGGKPVAPPKPPTAAPAGIPAAPKAPGAPGMTKAQCECGSKDCQWCKGKKKPKLVKDMMSMTKAFGEPEGRTGRAPVPAKPSLSATPVGQPPAKGVKPMTEMKPAGATALPQVSARPASPGAAAGAAPVAPPKPAAPKGFRLPMAGLGRVKG